MLPCLKQQRLMILLVATRRNEFPSQQRISYLARYFSCYLFNFCRRLKEFRSEQSCCMILVTGLSVLIVYTNTYLKVTFKEQLKYDFVSFADILTRHLKLLLHYLLLFGTTVLQNACFGNDMNEKLVCRH